MSILKKYVENMDKKSIFLVSIPKYVPKLCKKLHNYNKYAEKFCEKYNKSKPNRPFKLTEYNKKALESTSQALKISYNITQIESNLSRNLHICNLKHNRFTYIATVKLF